MTQTIDGFEFGRVVVRGMEYRADVIVLPNRIVDSWWRREGHRLAPEDLAVVVAASPAVLVVGTGAYGMMNVPDETRDFLATKGIKVEHYPTAPAVARYNELCRGGACVAAALHVTC